MYELIKGVSLAVALVLTLITANAYLGKKQYQEAWFFLAMFAILMVSSGK